MRKRKYEKDDPDFADSETKKHREIIKQSKIKKRDKNAKNLSLPIFGV